MLATQVVSASLAEVGRALLCVRAEAGSVTTQSCQLTQKTSVDA